MFEALFFFFIIAIGLIVGSFLNCLIYRLSFNQNLAKSLKGRSFCPDCGHKLSWQDLIPVISFIFLKGKCRYCRRNISLQYPLVEIATAAIFLQIFNFQFSTFNRLNFFSLVYLIVSFSFLIVIFVYDLKHYIIPNKVIYPAIALALIYNLFFYGIFNQNFSRFYISLLAGLGAALPFFLIVAVSRGKWMGGADIKLAFFMGLFLGWPNILPALFLAFVIGALFGLSLIALKQKTLKSEIPFAPFLISGTFIAFFWGGQIINWYASLFLI